MRESYASIEGAARQIPKNILAFFFFIEISR